MRIQTNLIVALAGKFKARNRDCRPFASDARVHVDSSRYFYPDVTVFCSPTIEDAQHSKKNPDVVIEISSDSTASFDKNEKAAAYRQMSSLKQLALIDSRERAVTIYTRNSAGAWVETMHDAATTSVVIADEDVSFAAIYESVL